MAGKGIVIMVLAALAWTGSCQLFTPVSQAIVRTTRGLTCSNPSPFLAFPALGGASVTSTCNGATNATTTDAAGQFSLVLNFPNPTTAASILGCQVSVTVPASCNILTLVRFRLVRATTLRSVLLILDSPVNATVPGGSVTFRPSYFLGSA